LRLNFLSLLRGGCEDYVVNEAALDYLRRQPVEATVIARLTKLQGHVFSSDLESLEHLSRCSINIFDRPLLQSLNEAAIWGAIRHHGLMETTVVVSDDAGQFRVATHALCWVHAERHLQKLMPASPKQAKAVELVREAIWCFYRSLKLWKQSPSPGGERVFRRQFNRIFGQRRVTRTSMRCSPAWRDARANCCRCSSVRRSRFIRMRPRTIWVPAGLSARSPVAR
jgi:hypothetical protein